MKKKQIAILGSTGSIGTQALSVIEEHADRLEAYCLTANNRVDLLAEQARRVRPRAVVIANEVHYERLRELLSDCPDIQVYAGRKALSDIVKMPSVDMVLTAMVGFAGLEPTISALTAGKTICLANKETLVVAGELISRLARENRAPILPVDSEHSAIFQSIVGEGDNEVSRILLTASGGPFRTYSREQLQGVRAEDALRHPTWTMGRKITIDSATMINKGFELIEAKWLFGVEAERIEVLVHPQSIVHSAVEFRDGAVKAQLGLPDMRLPIQYAFTYPDRLGLSGPRLDLKALGSLDFMEPDMERFPCLRLAIDAIGRGGNMPCILNAANEVANRAFLEGRIGFMDVARIIEQTMQTVAFDLAADYETYVSTDSEARLKAMEII